MIESLLYGILGGKIVGRWDFLVRGRAKDASLLSPEQRRDLMAKLPGFVSYPRTGSQWLNAVMELFFARPCLREGRATFLEHCRSDWMWFHDHDFDLTLDHPNVLYIYREPVDTIYSRLNIRFKATRRASFWGKFVQRNDHPYTPEKVDELALAYRKHLEKWLVSPRRARTLVRYEALVQDGVNEFRKVCEHFGVSMDEARVKHAFASVSKEALISVAVKKVALDPSLVTGNYANERQQFRYTFGDRIVNLVITPALKPFFL
jgi:hypothetical protein